MLPDEKVMCHETAFEKRCRDMVVNCHCRKWIQVMGNNPNTGEPINRWDCADAWAPLLAINTAQQARQTGAAVESLRNHVADPGGHVREIARRIQLAVQEPSSGHPGLAAPKQ